MANPKFEYPDATSPTTTIEFPRAEFQGDVAYPEPNQSSDTSQYGEIFTRTSGPTLDRVPLTAQVAIADQTGNTVDVTKLETFIKTTINFSSNPFYYTDSKSVVRKVKLINKDALSPTNDYPSYRQYKFDMKEVE